MRLSIVLPALALLLVPALAIGQSVTGDLEGWVLDDQDHPLVRAEVTVAGPNLQLPRSSASLEDGFFVVKGLPVGTYTVTIQHAGLRSVTYDDVLVQLGRATSLGKTTLVAEAYRIEDLVVTASQPSLDFSTTATGNNLDAKVLDRLPTPRDYREVIVILPQTNASYLGDETNVAGGTGHENQFFIEGVNVTDPFQGSNGTRLPQNFVQEVQVRRSGYMAEYGGATGGVINVITRSGNNDMGGQVFGFFTNNSLTSDSKRGLADVNQESFARYDLGLALGGAIARDKLWYFAAYNPTFETESLEIPGLAFHDDKAVSHLFAGKLSWAPDASSLVDLAVFGDPTQRDKVGGSIMIVPQATQLNADPLLIDQTTGAITASLRGQRQFGDRAIAEFSVSRSEANNSESPLTEIGRTEVTYMDLIDSELSGGMQNIFDHHTVRWSTSLSTTVFAGSHEVKVGAGYEDITLDEEWYNETPDGRPGVVWRTDTDLWMSSHLRNDLEISHRIPSVYLQDSWRIHDRLRLNGGLRWEGIYIVDPNGDVVQSINDGYQPRIGFTYRLDESGRQKVFGSYGRFTELLPLHASSWYFGDFYQLISFYDQNPLPDYSPVPVGEWLFDNGSLFADDLKIPYVDEFSLGYEREIGMTWKAGLRGIYRELGEAIEDHMYLDGTQRLGNPGKGNLDFLDEPVRRYTALELSLETTAKKNLHLAANYVLSRTYGNYPGVYDSDGRNPHSHVTTQYWTPEQSSEGLLPNDRTHVFKAYGSYDFDFGLTAGGFFTWQSGTPLSEYGGTWVGPDAYIHLVPRGTAGRTPSIWDLNLRLAYDLSKTAGEVAGVRTRLLFDVFHLFSQKKAVDIEQVHYYSIDENGEQSGLNPNYGKVRAYQPSMSLRFGIEATF